MKNAKNKELKAVWKHYISIQIYFLLLKYVYITVCVSEACY